MAERLKFIGFVAMGLWVSMSGLPNGCSAAGYGGGWLQEPQSTCCWTLVMEHSRLCRLGVEHHDRWLCWFGCRNRAWPLVSNFGKFNTRTVRELHSTGSNITIGVLGTIIRFRLVWSLFPVHPCKGFTGAPRTLAVVAAINTLLATVHAGGTARNDLPTFVTQSCWT